jgi:hypothetical protein
MLLDIICHRIYIALCLIFSRVALRTLLHAIRNKGLNQRHIVLVGSSELNQQVSKKLEIAQLQLNNRVKISSAIPDPRQLL